MRGLGKLVLVVALVMALAAFAVAGEDKAPEKGSSCELKAGKCAGCKDGEACKKNAASGLKPQTTCPVMGGKINEKLYVEYKGQAIFVCCPGCIDKVKADPEKYIKALKEKGQKPRCLACVKGGGPCEKCKARKKAVCADCEKAGKTCEACAKKKAECEKEGGTCGTCNIKKAACKDGCTCEKCTAKDKAVCKDGCTCEKCTAKKEASERPKLRCGSCG